MLLQIPGLLEAPQLDKILPVLSETPLVAGRLSAGKAARAVKNNLGRAPIQCASRC
jgi:predicted 2-oxoglutarate/Fe(II)-dependent dioxygenase YbiX